MMFEQLIPKNASYEDAREGLAKLPAEDKKFLRDEIQPYIDARKKIQGIKHLREKTGLSLKAGKSVVDVMSDGNFDMEDIREADPKLLDAIEDIEIACRKAIRICRDDKAGAALFGIKEQLAEIWEEITELPPPDDDDGEKAWAAKV